MESNLYPEIKVLIPQEELEAKIKEMAAEINIKYAGKELHLICVLKGGAYFMTELSKYITVPVTIDFMQASSYGAGTTSTGVVKINKDLDEPIEGRHVIVVEDIIDTGYTLSYLLDFLKGRHPASLELAAILNKPSRRVVDVEIDYYGFNVPDKFIVGFGLDADQKYRNLPYIGYIET